VLNFTLRIGMSCGDKIESRQIIGTNGCEVLPKHGKAIVRNGSEWLSATLVNTDRAEVADVVKYWQSDRCYKIA
jgi:DNA segregation ATPase FtsK/SpoIIIE-like protein